MGVRVISRYRMNEMYEKYRITIYIIPFRRVDNSIINALKFAIIHLTVNNTKIITRSDIVWKMFWLFFWEFSYQDYFVNFITNHFQNLFLIWHSNRSNAFENVFSKKSCWKNLLVLIRIVRDKINIFGTVNIGEMG